MKSFNVILVVVLVTASGAPMDLHVDSDAMIGNEGWIGGFLKKIPGIKNLLEKLQPIIHENIVTDGYLVKLVAKLKLLRLEILPADTQPTPEPYTTAKPTVKPTFRPEQKLNLEELREKCVNGNVTFVRRQMKIFGGDAVVNANGSMCLLAAVVCFDCNGNVNITRMVAFLIDAGADVNATDFMGHTPLHFASGAWGENNTEVAKMIIDAGANVNAKTEDGWTPLHLAALYGYTEVAKMIIDAGANVNAKTEDGWTPLHLAALHGQREVAKIIIDAGADVNAKDDKHNTPLRYATQYGNKEVAQILIDAGAKIYSKDGNGGKRLRTAIQKKNGASLDKAKESNVGQSENAQAAADIVQEW